VLSSFLGVQQFSNMSNAKRGAPSSSKRGIWSHRLQRRLLSGSSLQVPHCVREAESGIIDNLTGLMFELTMRGVVAIRTFLLNVVNT
jgi:hypothetical protein